METIHKTYHEQLNDLLNYGNHGYDGTNKLITFSG